MFDKLDDILMRLEEVLNQLSEPDVAADAAKFQKLMKEQAELQPIADAYKDYKTQNRRVPRRCRRRRGGTLYRRNLPYVHQIRREPRLENRADQRR